MAWDDSKDPEDLIRSNEWNNMVADQKDRVIGTSVNEAIADISSNRPAAGTTGRIFFETDTGITYYDDGSSWIVVGEKGGGGGLSVSQENTDLGNEESITLSRFTVPSGQSLEVYAGSVADDNGNWENGMEIEIFNHTDGTTEYVIESNTLQQGSPLYSGSDGDDIEIRMVNATGSSKTMTGQAQFDVA